MYIVGTLVFGIAPLFISYNLVLMMALAVLCSQALEAKKIAGYGVKHVILSKALSTSLFPAYLKGCLFGLTGGQLPFTVTPKARSQGDAMLLRRLWPQLTVIFLLVISLFAGLWRVSAGKITESEIWLILWTLFLVVIVASNVYVYFEELSWTIPKRARIPRGIEDQNQAPNMSV